MLTLKLGTSFAAKAAPTRDLLIFTFKSRQQCNTTLVVRSGKTVTVRGELVEPLFAY